MKGFFLKTTNEILILAFLTKTTIFSFKKQYEKRFFIVAVVNYHNYTYYKLNIFKCETQSVSGPKQGATRGHRHTLAVGRTNPHFNKLSHIDDMGSSFRHGTVSFHLQRISWSSKLLTFCIKHEWQYTFNQFHNTNLSRQTSTEIHNSRTLFVCLNRNMNRSLLI